MAANYLLQESRNRCTFDIQVTPKAAHSEIVGIQDRALKIKVTAPPVEGAANRACIELLAKKLGLKKSQMEIMAGNRFRKKTVMVKDICREELEEKINKALNK